MDQAKAGRQYNSKQQRLHRRQSRRQVPCLPIATCISLADKGEIVVEVRFLSWAVIVVVCLAYRQVLDL